MFRRELKIATLSCSSSLMQLKELNKRRMYRKSPLRYFSCTTNHLNHSNDIILILGVKSPPRHRPLCTVSREIQYFFLQQSTCIVYVIAPRHTFSNFIEYKKKMKKMLYYFNPYDFPTRVLEDINLFVKNLFLHYLYYFQSMLQDVIF